METEKKRFLVALIIPLLLLIIMWIVQFVSYGFDINLFEYGVHPLHWDGLPGILLMPFIHSGFKHLMANSLPFLILGTALFYFYRDLSLKVLIGIWLLSGIWVWFGGRENSWHIGASGVIYGLSSFLFFSGLIRKNTQLAALALVVAFLYGSMIWGVFPDFFPDKNISWEGHLGGLVSGIILAFYYRKSGPQRKRYSWEFEEEEDDDEDDDDGYWNISRNTTNST
ncbi:MAG: rhomboid family intramembrane serine protease [Chlorobi bacterium]|nr:rhomboid family intramembrane serine protease [Chlorobiota bacterium]